MWRLVSHLDWVQMGLQSCHRSLKNILASASSCPNQCVATFVRRRHHHFLHVRAHDAHARAAGKSNGVSSERIWSKMRSFLGVEFMTPSKKKKANRHFENMFPLSERSQNAERHYHLCFGKALLRGLKSISEHIRAFA